MHGQIVSGGQGVKAEAFGAADVTVTEAYLVRSEYDQPARNGGALKPAFQLVYRMKRDDGVESTGFYGGTYPNFVPGFTAEMVPKKARVPMDKVASIGFGTNGYAKAFINAWETALGRPAESIFAPVGSRFYVEPVSQIAGGKKSIKLFPKGAARSAAPLAQNAQPAVTPGAIAQDPTAALAALLASAQQIAVPAVPQVNGAEAWAKLSPAAQQVVKSTLSAGISPESIAKTLVETRQLPDIATATAAAAHAKGL